MWRTRPRVPCRDSLDTRRRQSADAARRECVRHKCGLAKIWAGALVLCSSIDAMAVRKIPWVVAGGLACVSTLVAFQMPWRVYPSLEGYDNVPVPANYRDK